ncbi:hypothetical protein PHSY_000189 [Pseudozyma hubeiensis SY62]|uniref:Uncharacterized protein n=1 Tax=Pseudozyma hubeiensis (strain SY62) TaxID=1305764 RepID=R9P3E9_PSEHS|nr:hypothetical protein PHSY_000189 [Pseudozyma hubeiensis SY62]GAC92635.1 hypothetical protein PHSY_000189 [Pseudozyma hubeiensis SY62]
MLNTTTRCSDTTANSKHHGLVLVNAFNIGSFKFEPILEMLQDPALHTEALDEIQMLAFACFGKAEKILDTARFGFKFISEQQREPLQAYIDLFGEAATVLECIAYIVQLQSLGASKSPETIRRIVEIAKEVFSTWPTAAEDQDEVGLASVEALAAATSSRRRSEDVSSARLQEKQSYGTPDGSTSLNNVDTGTAIPADSGASLHHVQAQPGEPMVPSEKKRKVAWENDDEVQANTVSADNSTSSNHVQAQLETSMTPSRKQRRATVETDRDDLVQSQSKTSMILSRKRPRVTVETDGEDLVQSHDDDAPERRNRHVFAEMGDGEAGEASILAPEPGNGDKGGICSPAPKSTKASQPVDAPPCERFDSSIDLNSRFGLSSPLAFRENHPSTADGHRLSFVGRVLLPTYYVSKKYKEMKLQLSHDTYLTVMNRNDSMMYYSVQHESLANRRMPMVVRNVMRGRGGNFLLFDGQSRLEPIGREYTVEQVFEFNDAYDREFRT